MKEKGQGAIRSRETSNVRRLPTSARGEQTFQKILAVAAAKLAAGEPIIELTTATVAKEAGVSLSSLYWFFPDVLAILDALRIKHHEIFWKRQTKMLLLHPPRSAEEMLSAATAEFIGYLNENPDFKALLYGGGYPRWVVDKAPDTPAEITKTYLVQKFGVQAGPQLDLRFTLWMEVSDRIIGYAFRQPARQRAAIFRELDRMASKILLSE